MPHARGSHHVAGVEPQLLSTAPRWAPCPSCAEMQVACCHHNDPHCHMLRLVPVLEPIWVSRLNQVDILPVRALGMPNDPDVVCSTCQVCADLDFPFHKVVLGEDGDEGIAGSW